MGTVIQDGSGSGDGYGSGSGDGSGDGYGYGFGDGDGYGYGYGFPEQEIGGMRCKLAGFATREGIEGASFSDLATMAMS